VGGRAARRFFFFFQWWPREIGFGPAILYPVPRQVKSEKFPRTRPHFPRLAIRRPPNPAACKTVLTAVRPPAGSRQPNPLGSPGEVKTRNRLKRFLNHPDCPPRPPPDPPILCEIAPLLTHCPCAPPPFFSNRALVRGVGCNRFPPQEHLICFSARKRLVANIAYWAFFPGPPPLPRTPMNPSSTSSPKPPENPRQPFDFPPERPPKTGPFPKQI